MAQMKFIPNVLVVSEKKSDSLQLTGARKYQVLGKCKGRKKNSISSLCYFTWNSKCMTDIANEHNN